MEDTITEVSTLAESVNPVTTESINIIHDEATTNYESITWKRWSVNTTKKKTSLMSDK